MSTVSMFDPNAGYLFAMLLVRLVCVARRKK